MDISNTTITSVAIPTKNNAVFMGYYDSETEGTQIIPADGVLPAAATFKANTE
jgi:hypothetical protein